MRKGVRLPCNIYNNNRNKDGRNTLLKSLDLYLVSIDAVAKL